MTIFADHQVLSRKYRPKKLSELVGQDTLVKTLQYYVKEGKIPHAILFHGIRGVGKTTTARIVAKIFNCEGQDPNNIPCCTCEACLAIDDDRHLDVIEIDAASKTGVDDIRDIINSIQYKAVKSQYKVYIIDEVHMLSKSAFNALLKTLEEPPTHVKFIFATTEIHKIPDTILSRCIRFDLKRVNSKELVSYLKDILTREKIETDEESLPLIGKVSEGSVRDALSLLDQAIAVGQGRLEKSAVDQMLGTVNPDQITNLLIYLLNKQANEAIQKVSDLFFDGFEALQIIDALLECLYAFISEQMKVPSNIPGRYSFLQEDVRAIKIPSSMQAWQVLFKGRDEVLKAPYPEQALQMVLLRLICLADFPNSADLVTILDSKGAGPSYDNIRTITTVTKREDIKQQLRTEPESFHDLVERTLKARHPILYSQIINDVHPVSFSSKTIVVRLKNQSAGIQLIRDWQKAMKDEGLDDWKIETSNEAQLGGKTIQEVKLDQKKVLINQSHEQPLVQELYKNFPNAIIQVKS